MRLVIEQDHDAESPREWDNLGKMVCFHRRYDLGDKQDTLRYQDFNTWEAVQAYLEKTNPGCLILPVYLYDHSGLAVSTASFNDRWDSGQIGFIYLTRADILANWPNKGRLTPTIKKQAYAALQAEVETYDQYLRGEVYCYTIEDSEGLVVDACCGFYGEKACREAGEEALSILTTGG